MHIHKLLFPQIQIQKIIASTTHSNVTHQSITRYHPSITISLPSLNQSTGYERTPKIPLCQSMHTLTNSASSNQILLLFHALPSLGHYTRFKFSDFIYPVLRVILHFTSTLEKTSFRILVTINKQNLDDVLYVGYK